MFSKKRFSGLHNKMRKLINSKILLLLLFFLYYCKIPDTKQTKNVICNDKNTCLVHPTFAKVQDTTVNGHFDKCS